MVFFFKSMPDDCAYILTDVLHNSLKELTQDTLVKASNGKLYPALTVFALALKYFRDHALQELSDQCGMKIVNDDVRWVISVPAIWRASAKQFMRQAAYEVIYSVFFILRQAAYEVIYNVFHILRQAAYEVIYNVFCSQL